MTTSSENNKNPFAPSNWDNRPASRWQVEGLLKMGVDAEVINSINYDQAKELLRARGKAAIDAKVSKWFNERKGLTITEINARKQR